MSSEFQRSPELGQDEYKKFFDDIDKELTRNACAEDLSIILINMLNKLGFSDTEADQLITVEYGSEYPLIPAQWLFSSDIDSAREWSRMTIFSFVLPLAEAALDEKQLDTWVPLSIDLAIAGDNHSVNCLNAAKENRCDIPSCPYIEIYRNTAERLNDPLRFNYELKKTIRPRAAEIEPLRRYYAAQDRDIFSGPEDVRLVTRYYETIRHT